MTAECELLVCSLEAHGRLSKKSIWIMESKRNSYCNSIIQCLYYSNPFREHVVGFPRRTQPSERPLTSPAHSISPTNGILKSPQSPNGAAETSPRKSARSGALSSLPVPAKAEDKESPEYKKKLALASGPVLNVDFEHSNDYGMNQSLFTSLKDIFEAIIGHQSRMGVVSPNKFLEILRRDNEMFRTAMHQDAHEFLNILLNQVVESVEEYTKKLGGCAFCPIICICAELLIN